MIKLKPCPFCGNDKISKCFLGYPNKKYIYYDECNECRSSTAAFDTPQKADKQWNTRVKPSNHKKKLKCKGHQKLTKEK